MQKLGERGRFAKVSMYVRISVFAVLVVCTAVIIYKIRAAVPENSFAVMTYNAGGITKKTDTQELADAIRTGGVPDLIFLQEVRRQRDTSRLAALLNLDYYIYAPYKDSKKSGLAILARIPLTDSKSFHFKASDKGYGMLTAQMNMSGKKILVCSFHFDRVTQVAASKAIPFQKALGIVKRELFNTTVRSRCADELFVRLDENSAENLIIGGDFNTFPFSRAIRKVPRKYNDALWPSKYYFSATYSKLIFWITPRIDYLFHSSGFKSLNAKVIKKGPGDHFPVRTVLGFI